MNAANYAAALQPLRANLAQATWVLADLIKTNAPSWSIRNARQDVAEVTAQITKVSDLSFAFGRA